MHWHNLFEIKNDLRLILKNVKHYLDVFLNLIYMGDLDDEGYVNIVGIGQLMLTKGSMIVVRGNTLSTIIFMDSWASFQAAQ